MHNISFIHVSLEEQLSVNDNLNREKNRFSEQTSRAKKLLQESEDDRTKV